MDKSNGHHARSSSDPLLDALRAQHVNESQDQRQDRLRKEAEAKKISDAIDEQLKAEEKSKSKKRTEIKILLLGSLTIPRPAPAMSLRYTSRHSITLTLLCSFFGDF
jgi:hypothetical protein